jgi:hypothetical protein
MNIKVKKAIIPAITFVFAVMVLSSCTKNNVNRYMPNDSKLPSILSYFNVLSKKTNAAFGVSFSSSMSDIRNEQGPLQFNGVFIADDGGVLRGGKVKLGSREFFPDNNNLYGTGELLDRSIIGTKQQFSLQKPLSFAGSSSTLAREGNFEYPTTTDELYVPEILDFIDLKLDYIAEKNIIRVGSEYLWKPDTKNLEKGIIVGIEYTPGNIGNENLRQEYPTDIKNGIVIPDDGKYNLPESLFAGIPDGARVTVTFGRANYKVTTDENEVPYVLYAYNYKYFDYTFKR